MDGRARRYRGHRRPDDRVHAARDRGDRGAVRAQSRARGVGAAGGDDGGPGEAELLHFGGLHAGASDRRRVLSMSDVRGQARASAAIDFRAAARPRPAEPPERPVGGQAKAGDSDGWRGREGRQGRGRGAEEAGSARRAHGALHGPGARTLRLRVAAAAPVPAGAGRGGRGAAGDRRPACRRSTSPSSAPARRARC